MLEPVLQAGSTWRASSHTSRNRGSTASAYLRVPGCDVHETRAFFPASIRRAASSHAPKWHACRDPLLLLLNRSPTFPERCLIPRFPDDPKSRFVDELDEELTESPVQGKGKESPSKGSRPGRWRSVRSLEQFWELMAFRQECSSGRLVGFLWGVFEPEEGGMRERRREQDGFAGNAPVSPTRKAALATPAHSQKNEGSSSHQRISSMSSSSPPPASTLDGSSFRHRPEKTAYFFWPTSTRGTIVLPRKHYDRANKLLLHLDYATLDVAVESTKRWVEDVAMCAGKKDGWGVEVVGEKELPIVDGGDGREEKAGDGGGGVNMLGAGMVRKKKRSAEEEVGGGEAEDGEAGGGGVQVLSAGLVRKKPKVK